MEFPDKYFHNDYYDIDDKSCLSPAAFYFKNFRNKAKAIAVCPLPTYPSKEEMSRIDDPWEMLQHVLRILCTVLLPVFWFALARVVTQNCSKIINADSVVRFLVEFVVIVIPMVILINIINEIVEAFVAVLALLLLFVIWRSGCLQRATERRFMIGLRPRSLTLGRGIISMLTALCILAIDFETFPKHFRKTRTYGVGLMDTGIGLFVFSMGSVSKRPKVMKDFVRMLKIVMPLLLLGFIRTIVVIALGYHQDEHEYGMHLNAFFTLGLTKLFGTLISYLARKDTQLLFLSVAVLTFHEIFLQYAIADYVMNNATERISLVNANREGLFSLPGFIGIYIFSMYLGFIWKTTESLLSFHDFICKIKRTSIISLCLWLLTVLSIFTVSIARVTCNFGYGVWILGIATFVILMLMIVFDLVLNTLSPIDEKFIATYEDGGEGALLVNAEKTTNSNPSNSKFAMPSLMEAVNMNGLVFFLIANILTGAVNIFLMPESRTNFEGYFILCIYMLLSTSVVYVLYKRKIRIG